MIKKKEKVGNSIKCEKVNCGTIFSIFLTFCNSEVPALRRTTFDIIVDLIPFLEETTIVIHIIPLLTSMLSDFQREIRINTVNVCIALLRNISNKLDKEVVFLCLARCSVDSSWRLRENYGKNFGTIMHLAGDYPKAKLLFEIFFKLLEDEEIKVCCGTMESIRMLFELSWWQEKSIRENCYSIFDNILDEKVSIDEKKIKLSEIICDIFLVEKDDNLEKKLLEIIKKLLKMENDAISYNVLKKVRKIIKKIGAKTFLQSFSLNIFNLAKNSKWRLRKNNIRIFKALAKKMESKDFEILIPLVHELLSDDVNYLREKACKLTWQLSQIYGIHWAKTALFPVMHKLSECLSYLLRMTPLYFLHEYGILLGIKTVEEDFFLLLIRLCNDRILNVSEYAFKVAFKLLPEMTKPLQNSFLTQLKNKEYVERLSPVVNSSHITL